MIIFVFIVLAAFAACFPAYSIPAKVDAPPPGSYYSPVLKTTVGITFVAPQNDPIWRGASDNLIVATDLGRRIYAFKHGKLIWVRDYPDSWPRAMDIFEGKLYIADGSHIEVRDPRSGDLHHRFEIKEATAPITSIRLDRTTEGVRMVVAYDSSMYEEQAESNVRVYRIHGQHYEEIYATPRITNHTRDAYIDGDNLVVSATYDNLVYGVDMKTNRTVFSRSVYFPNSIQAQANGSVLICAEHENRVFLWNPVTNVSELLFSAPHYPYNDIKTTRETIIKTQGKTSDSHSPYHPRKSIVAKEYSGTMTLYSPNSAYIYDEDLVISDSDNHRVIVVRDGKIITEITGFNNPVNTIRFQ
ncbi:MAG: hypothetical protein ACOYNL_08520 [Rickettsiales bacterium]